jgi:hypothetical protein
VTSEIQTGEIQCVGCGCTDSRPCPGGCAWAAVNEDEGIGLCTNCAVLPLDELLAAEGLIL